MNNKLDAFNNDKFRCPKCKEYFDVSNGYHQIVMPFKLCKYCDGKWVQYCCNNGRDRTGSQFYLKSFNRSLAINSFEDWCKDEKT